MPDIIHEDLPKEWNCFDRIELWWFFHSSPNVLKTAFCDCFAYFS